MDTSNTFFPHTNSLLSNRSTLESDIDQIYKDTQLIDQVSTDANSKTGIEDSFTADSVRKKKSSDSEGEGNNFLFRRESSPFIKTVMAERTITDYDKFNMHAWAEFQEILKSNFFIIKSGKFKFLYFRGFGNRLSFAMCLFE